MRRASFIGLCFLLAATLPGAACQERSARRAGAAAKPSGAIPAAVPAVIRAAVEAPDRSDADRALDAGRQPAQMLAAFGVAPGMRVLELGAGTGYTTELLARVVGPTGRVYGQNSPYILERFAQKPWSERLARPALSRTIRLDLAFDAPLPEDVRDLDLVVNVLFYHDTVWMDVDRGRMNRNVFQALRKGGTYAVVDHSARPGDGISQVRTLHRIEEEVVREEIERAGFRLTGTAEFLRNPEDARDWNASPGAAGERRGTSDRFVLLFTRP